MKKIIYALIAAIILLSLIAGGLYIQKYNHKKNNEENNSRQEKADELRRHEHFLSLQTKEKLRLQAKLDKQSKKEKNKPLIKKDLNATPVGGYEEPLIDIIYLRSNRPQVENFYDKIDDNDSFEKELPKDLEAKSLDTIKKKPLDKANTKDIIDEKNKDPSKIKEKSSSFKAGKRPKLNIKGKPKLVIIIDDIANPRQANMVKKTKLRLNPSFLPPTKANPNSAKLAKDFSFYLVHLPMQALHYSSPEPNTLKINDSFEQIQARLKQIKKDFPRVKYINNHTGSRFTQNTKAMRRFYKSLQENGLFFIDSRTIASSKSPRMAREYGLPYFSRDVFLDNKSDISYIKARIKELLKIAKKRGYAIAIGHPKPNTMKALSQASELFKDYELVYLPYLFEQIK